MSSFSRASAVDNTPPEAITGSLPASRATVWARMALVIGRSGAPLNPPVSPASLERSSAGRCRVVLPMITPSMRAARIASRASSSSALERSGASLTSTGTRLPPVAAASRRCASGSRIASSAWRVCSERKPGVLGELTLTAR